MVALWVIPGVGTIEDEGLVRLNDGRVFDLSSVPGNGYNAQRLGKINSAIQDEIDNRVLLTSLPIDDPDRTVNPNAPNLFWSDVDGNPVSDPAGAYLCSRSVKVWLTYENSVLLPNVSNP